jgi:protein-tyrosine phosphatase
VFVRREHCRSPLAQSVLESVLRREGLEDERFFIGPAGTGSWHVGRPPDHRAQRSASACGLDLRAQRTRRIAPEDCEDFDYMLTMNGQNYRVLASLCRGSAVVRPLLDFASDSPEREVPDPYSDGPEGFDRGLDLVEVVSEGLRKTSASGTWPARPEGGIRLKKGAHGCACAS